MTSLRDDTPISVNGDLPNGIPKYLKESSVFKSVRAEKIDDDYPCFLLKDVTITKPDGTVGNLLYAELEGPYLVQGQLVFDAEEAHIEDCKLFLQVPLVHY
jgi:hypothetical protein